MRTVPEVHGTASVQQAFAEVLRLADENATLKTAMEMNGLERDRLAEENRALKVDRDALAAQVNGQAVRMAALEAEVERLKEQWEAGKEIR